VVEAFLSIGVSYALFKFYVKDIEWIFTQEKRHNRNQGDYSKLIKEQDKLKQGKARLLDVSLKSPASTWPN
jgi:hypothetical protein